MSKVKRDNRCGIYVIEQTGTGHFYIGSSADIERRWYMHRKALNIGKHHAPRLQRAWTKHGADAFTFSVLEECAKADLLIQEQAYLDTFKPAFNSALVAGRPPGWSSWSKASQDAFRQALRERMAAITHCPRGHVYDDANTYRNKKGKRGCRACNAERVAGVYAKETSEQREVRLRCMDNYYEANKPKLAAQMREYAATRKEQKRAYDQARAEQKREADHKRRAVANLTPEQLEAQRQARRDAYARDPERTRTLAHEHYIRRRERERLKAVLSV